MQELEKILEEINAGFDRRIRTQLKITAGLGDDVYRYGYGKSLEAYQQGKLFVEDIIRKHINDGWIPVEERLPDKEADKFIKEKLDGIGYLYPCLLTYRSPNTERIHVVRFYYDVYERWFVNAGEELCDKDRCIAWRPLPEPYRPERSDNHDGE